MGGAGYLDQFYRPTCKAAIIESDDLVHIVEWVNPEFQNGDSHHGWFCAVPTNKMYGMEVSKHRERTPGSNEETLVMISPYQSSPRVISRCSDSTNAGSMTAPC
ncbi:hypothetical protein COP2_027071 [Malus domestica]